jgi:RNA polymerase sigma-70 factor (ECF subfamily)
MEGAAGAAAGSGAERGRGPAGAPAGPASGPAGSDAGLLEGVRARDPAALAAFFERHFDRIYGLVYRLLGERTAAEDVTQEVFLKVYRAAHQIDATRDPGPWLTTIAYNACRDRWRSGAYRLARRSESIEADPALVHRLENPGNDPEAELLAGERARLVREAIEQLPEPLRVAVLLYEYQGLSHQEVSELTGLNHAAARKRYSRALAELGKILGKTLA